MEDVTDPSFRLICREMGAASVYTEFVSAEALIRDIKSTTRKLDINDAERPVAIQIYGREPEAMVEAAKIVEQARPDRGKRHRLVSKINIGYFHLYAYSVLSTYCRCHNNIRRLSALVCQLSIEQRHTSDKVESPPASIICAASCIASGVRERMRSAV